MSDKVYNPKDIEDKFYKIWEDRGYFELDANKAIQNEKTFAIMMPPPNVTGVLHIGHALTFTLQDIIVRFKRMDGYRTLWQAGTDHAGIATQNVVEKQLLEQNITKEEIGREAFLEKVWEWKEYSGGAIVNQMRSLGVSPDFSRERFTMDEGLKSAVKEAFVKLYDEGLIIRGNYMVNWCTHDGALSDIEVEHDTHQGALYHIKYPLANSDEYIVVATTRPETYFGDTAVMVNPNDERYTHLLGKKIRLPLIDRDVTIIADEHVDMEFGTGCVKVTPAHDTNDYEVGKRHDLEMITIFDEKGILNEQCGDFAGLERLEAREIIVKALDEAGFMEKIEEHTHEVGHCYRCKNIVEPYISKQWFVKKEIATRAIERVNAGEAKFFPAHWINSYNAWMGELRDWCISRQLWWGHQIPVFYCDDCEHEFASKEERPSACPKCGSTHLTQDKDVLDTWFSSALWPFSTLGWGNGAGSNDKFEVADLAQFYPNSLLITGFDILFFWVARMIIMGETFMGALPFKDIYLHALVRDEKGDKMSKSKGNVIDPLTMIETYSADALRFTLALLAVQGRDIKLSIDKLELSRNFTNKLFNASKYLLMKHKRFEDLSQITVQTELGKYMLSRFYRAINDVRENMKSYRFNDAASTLYRFLWGEFCDWGIELSKTDSASVSELGSIYKESMKLLHPFMPFISEYIYHSLSDSTLEEQSSIMIRSYPQAKAIDEATEAMFSVIIDAIVAIRRAKALVDLANQRIEKAQVKTSFIINEALAKEYIQKLAKVQSVEFVTSKPENAVSDIGEFSEVYIPTSSIDLTPIINRLTKQKEKLTKEMAKLSGMLNNKKFVENAPKEVVAQNQTQLSDLTERMKKIDEQLASLS